MLKKLRKVRASSLEQLKELRLKQQEEALNLRARGLSTVRISDKLGIPLGAVNALLRDATKRYEERSQELIREERQIESTRLEAIIESLWEDAVDYRDLEKSKHLLKVLESKRKLLGLDSKYGGGGVQPGSENSIASAGLRAEIANIIRAEILGVAIPEPKALEANNIQEAVFEEDTGDTGDAGDAGDTENELAEALKGLL